LKFPEGGGFFYATCLVEGFFSARAGVKNPKEEKRAGESGTLFKLVVTYAA
jgi:hypothetical protein